MRGAGFHARLRDSALEVAHAQPAAAEGAECGPWVLSARRASAHPSQRLLGGPERTGGWQAGLGWPTPHSLPLPAPPSYPTGPASAPHGDSGLLQATGFLPNSELQYFFFFTE